MSIWRLGQIKEEDLEVFGKENMLAFEWMDSNINYTKEKELKKFNGWTCIDPWINEVKENDIIFLVSKYNYAGVAFVLGSYGYKKYSIKIKDRVLPGIPVKFIHLLNKPIEHNFNIRSMNPRTFSNINQLGFDLNEILRFINSYFPDKHKSILDLINKFAPEHFNKITRVCWNDNGWTKPSGPIGKATTLSHEKKYGFGHEEWLFDTSRIINGYQYGFLEAVRKFQNNYEGKKFNLLLFTRDSISKQNFWVGQLKNVEVINKDQAKFIIQKFKEKGLIDIMKSQLETVGLDGSKLENEYLNETDIINIRFRKNEIQNIFENPIQVEDNDNRISSTRYVLLPWDSINNIEPPEDDDYFETGNTGNGKLKGKTKTSHKSQTKEVELTHNLISDSLLEYLKKEKGANKVRRECRVNGNNRIDIVVRENNEDIFYEIKTYPLLKTCLRYALGQLIEYSCYPEKNRAKKFYLVSDIKADKKFEKYIKHLNKNFNFDLGYICYDIEKKEIIQNI